MCSIINKYYALISENLLATLLNHSKINSSTVYTLLSGLSKDQLMDRLYSILKNIDHVFTHSNAQKHIALAPVAGVFTRADLKGMGLKINSYQYQKALKSNTPLSEEAQTIPTIMDATIPTNTARSKQHARMELITKKLEENSMPSSYRLVKYNGAWKSVHFLEKSKQQIYNELIKEKKIDISKSHFYRLIPKYFKVGQKKTDYCHLCTAAAKDKKTLKKLSEQEAQGRLPSNLASLKKELEFNLEKYELHANAKTQQRKLYKQQLEQLQSNECVIIADFKENLKIGGSPVETGKEFYHKRQVSLLGFACVWKKKDKIRTKYFDFFSYCLSHTSFFAKSCMKQLLQHCFFNSFSKLHIWVDRSIKSNQRLIFPKCPSTRLFP